MDQQDNPNNNQPKRNQQEKQDGQRKKEKPNDLFFLPGLTHFVGISYVVLVLLALVVSTYENVLGLILHPLLWAPLAYHAWYFGEYSMKILGVAMAYNGSKGKGLLSRWFYKKFAGKQVGLPVLYGYGVVAGFFIFGFLTVNKVSAMRPEPGTPQMYFAVLYASLILLGIWFGIFLTRNDIKLEVGETADETLQYYVKNIEEYKLKKKEEEGQQ